MRFVSLKQEVPTEASRSFSLSLRLCALISGECGDAMIRML